ncbi:6608_t:CDS:2, partial [Rhizophagus irregularis]
MLMVRPGPFHQSTVRDWTEDQDIRLRWSPNLKYLVELEIPKQLANKNTK